MSLIMESDENADETQDQDVSFVSCSQNSMYKYIVITLLK